MRDSSVVTHKATCERAFSDIQLDSWLCAEKQRLLAGGVESRRSLISNLIVGDPYRYA